MSRPNKNMEVETVIGEQAEFNGTLKSEGSVRIEGKVDGTIEVEGYLSMGENAVIKADINVGSITISGTVEGNIVCEERVQLVAPGRLKGNVTASDLTIGEGAFFDGQCRMATSSGSRIPEPE